MRWAVCSRRALTVFRIAADGSLSALGGATATRDEPTAVLIHYPQ
jgi:hypothetical protein